MDLNKLGRIFDLKKFSNRYEYAAVPFCGEEKDGLVEVFFSSRDEENRSILLSFTYDLEEMEVKSFNEGCLLGPGELGTFDDSGVMGTDYLNVNGREWIYYIGWNLGITVPFRNSLGVAEKDKNGLWNKLYPGPILDRNKNEPHFNASSCIIKESDCYKIWYLSCVKWEKLDDEVRHYYHIKYATSDNGIDWNRDGMIAIDFESEHEYAISVPRVIKIGGKYHMWFSSRATEHCEKYQIRYAVSNDGLVWGRAKAPVLSQSGNDWESDMVCYPYILPYKNKLFMFYNGNEYGKSGIGLAEIKVK